MGAIDFTYSNGDQKSSKSLHFVRDNSNQYLSCLKSVVNILAQYDSDGKYPFYGFGAIPEYMGATEVSDCFPLNGDVNNPNV